ncbi:MAG: type II toxin-antitoxin system VapC family toxin [Candidatus Nanopusillus sp.]
MKDNAFLFDASALYKFLTVYKNYTNKIDYNYIYNIYILDLTFYEIGNTIWKDYYIFKRINNPIETSETIYEILKEFNVIENLSLSFTEIIKIAIEKNLTYYDASYVYASKIFGLILVSEDKDLIEKGNAISVKEFIEKYLKNNN